MEPGDGVLMGNCVTGVAALSGMLEAEYAFSLKARESVRGAFLDYLADDAQVLEPTPTPGRAFYAASQDSSDRLERYPAMADLAGSGDVGFTAGPWTDTAGSGGLQQHGHFVTIWRQDSNCRWRVQVDAGISHPGESTDEPRLASGQVKYTTPGTPPPSLVTQDAAGHAIGDFQDTARHDGVAAGLRTYARTRDFQLYSDGQAPLQLGAANLLLTAHPISGDWIESARGRSADSSLAYAVGVLRDANQLSSHAYVQIWQYEPRVANWGLRLLLINPLTPSMSK